MYMTFRLTSGDKEVELKCAKAWGTWELNTLTLINDPSTVDTTTATDEWIMAFAKIEW